MPLVDPQLVRETFEQNQQVRAYYSVADVLDVDRYQIDGTDRALVLGVRELDQSGINDGDQNWSNLHTVYTHGNGIIAAYANQRPADNGRRIARRRRDRSGPRGCRAPSQDALTELATGGFETRIYFGEQSPDYSVVGKAGEDADDVELDLPGTTDATRTRHGRTPRRTTATGGVAGRQHLQPADVRREVRRAELPALRAGSTATARSSTTATRASGSRRSRRG